MRKGQWQGSTTRDDGHLWQARTGANHVLGYQQRRRAGEHASGQHAAIEQLDFVRGGQGRRGALRQGAGKC